MRVPVQGQQALRIAHQPVGVSHKEGIVAGVPQVPAPTLGGVRQDGRGGKTDVHRTVRLLQRHRPGSGVVVDALHVGRVTGLVHVPDEQSAAGQAYVVVGYARDDARGVHCEPGGIHQVVEVVRQDGAAIRTRHKITKAQAVQIDTRQARQPVDPVLHQEILVAAQADAAGLRTGCMPGPEDCLAAELHRLFPTQVLARPGGGRGWNDALTVVGTHIHQTKHAHGGLAVIGVEQGRKIKGEAQQQSKSAGEADLQVAIIKDTGENVLDDVVVDMVLPLRQQNAGPVKQIIVGRQGDSPRAQGGLDHVEVNGGAGDVQRCGIGARVGEVLPQPGVKDHHHIVGQQVHPRWMGMGGQQALRVQVHQQRVAGLVLIHRPIARHGPHHQSRIYLRREDQAASQIDGQLPPGDLFVVMRNRLQLRGEISRIMRRRVHQKGRAGGAFTAGRGNLHQEAPVSGGGEIAVGGEGDPQRQNGWRGLTGRRDASCACHRQLHHDAVRLLAQEGQGQHQEPPVPPRKNPTLEPARDFR